MQFPTQKSPYKMISSKRREKKLSLQFQIQTKSKSVKSDHLVIPPDPKKIPPFSLICDQTINKHKKLPEIADLDTRSCNLARADHSTQQNHLDQLFSIAFKHTEIGYSRLRSKQLEQPKSSSSNKIAVDHYSPARSEPSEHQKSLSLSNLGNSSGEKNGDLGFFRSDLRRKGSVSEPRET
ncbi:hypothetical protein AAC387_Pa12g1288 [Persea americana]